MKKKKDNLLDYIPRKNPNLKFQVNDKGHIELIVENRGFYNKVAQKFFHRPKVSYLELDEYGSFLWTQVDGEKNILELSEKMRERFGEKAEPVIDRLIQFIKMLVVRNFLFLKKGEHEK